MGLEQVFQGAAATVFNVAGDIAKDATYISITDDGINDQVEESAEIKVIFDTFSIIEIGMSENVMPGDSKGTLLAPDFPFTPKKGDKLVSSGITFYVEGYSKDPAGATLELHLRSV